MPATTNTLAPILIRFLGERTMEKRQILNFCSLVAHSKVFICADSRLYALQRFQKLETVKSVWKTRVTQQFAVACRQSCKTFLPPKNYCF